jgi:hypothetical protein
MHLARVGVLKLRTLLDAPINVLEEFLIAAFMECLVSAQIQVADELRPFCIVFIREAVDHEP